MNTENPIYKRDLYGGLSIHYNEMYTKKDPHHIPLPQSEPFAHGIIVGSSGSGKTSLLLTLVPKYKNLSGIIVCSLVDHPIFDLIKQHCQQKKIKYYFTDDIQQSSDTLVDEIERKPAGTHTLVIYDDIVTGKSMKSSTNSKENQILSHLFQKSRNYNVNLILICQSYTLVPTNVRNNANFLCYFKIKGTTNKYIFNKDAISIIGDDDNGQVMECINQVDRELHAYCIINANSIYLYLPSVGYVQQIQV